MESKILFYIIFVIGGLITGLIEYYDRKKLIKYKDDTPVGKEGSWGVYAVIVLGIISLIMLIYELFKSIF